jgi:hypothetical protein
VEKFDFGSVQYIRKLTIWREEGDERKGEREERRNRKRDKRWRVQC